MVEIAFTECDGSIRAGSHRINPINLTTLLVRGSEELRYKKSKNTILIS
ncbi:hypothetical protein H1057_05160 [Clostridium sporogenes]|nr:hypothetical protein [Clostridium sporogenes]